MTRMQKRRDKQLAKLALATAIVKLIGELVKLVTQLLDH